MEPLPNLPVKPRVKHIQNKRRRAEVFAKVKKEWAALKSKKRKRIKAEDKKAKETGAEPRPKKVPRTTESTRELDESMVNPLDDEVAEDEAVDEFTNYFLGLEPKVLITTNVNPSANVQRFITQELLSIFPNSEYRRRQTFNLRDILRWCVNREYTDVIVVNENRKKPNAMLFVHLPHGPSALFKLSSIEEGKRIQGHAKQSTARPELILNNFNTRLGHTIGRMLAALFPQNPEFRGRTSVTFHNQRDFIFFRRHRYYFDNPKKVRIQEMGPRFTLKLRALQKGIWDTKKTEYEYIHKKELDTSRRRFFL